MQVSSNVLYTADLMIDLTNGLLSHVIPRQIDILVCSGPAHVMQYRVWVKKESAYGMFGVFVLQSIT